MIADGWNHPSCRNECRRAMSFGGGWLERVDFPASLDYFVERKRRGVTRLEQETVGGGAIFSHIITEGCKVVDNWRNATDLRINLRTDFTVRLFNYLRNLWDDQSLQESSNRFHCSIIRLFDYLRNSWDGQSLQESLNRSLNRSSNWSWNQFLNRFYCSIIWLFEKFVRWPIITRIFEPILEPIFEPILEPIFEPISLFDYTIWEICEMANHYKNLWTDFTVRLFDYLRNLWDGQSLEESILFLFDVYSI